MKSEMLPNLILTVTNSAALYPLYKAYKSKDWLTFYPTALIASASSVSHFVENYRHSFSGLIPVSKETAILLNKIDMILCIPAALRMAYIVYKRKKIPYRLILLSFFLNVIPYFKNITPEMFVLTHSLWHIMIFYTMGHIIS
jgi:hypothetical protein